MRGAMKQSVRVYLITIYVLFLHVEAQNQMRNCQQIVPAAMNEFRGCIDYMHNILFNVQYNSMNAYTVQQHCQSTQYVQCNAALKSAVSGCLDFYQQEASGIIFRIVETDFAYWCMDYGKNLMDFYGKRAPDCYYQSYSLLRHCEDENPIVNVRLRTYDDEYCRVLNDVMRCQEQIYRSCLSHEQPDLISNYYNTIWRTTPCAMTTAAPLRNAVASNISKLKMSQIWMTFTFVAFLTLAPIIGI